MSGLRAFAADLRRQLAAVESQIRDADLELCVKVANMDECPVWKKRAMDPHGFVYNVCELLNDGYEHMCEEYGGKTLRSVAGKPGTDKWEDFQLRVIQHLKDTGVFGSDDYFEDFEDTAGGCDEVLQDETDEVIKKMLKEQTVQVD
jgi:hypothetical protein